MPTTLVAVSGMSPAIITETLWALATETPATVPDEVVVITTSKGEADIRRDLLGKNDAWSGKSVWESLRADIFTRTRQPKTSRKLQLSIRVIELPDAATGLRAPAEDVRTREHNEEAANFIVQTLAPLADAQDQHLIASIAGGRKTMGALLYAAMSLLGKETDRITHVLVSEPFDTVRGFFYPNQPVQTLEARPFDKPAVKVKASRAKIELATLPFVPLRNKFAELNEPRRTFAGLVESYSRAERPLAGPPAAILDIPAAMLTLQGKSIPLSGRTLVVASYLFERVKNGAPPFPDLAEAAANYPAYFKRWQARHPFHKAAARYTNVTDAGSDLTKALSELRKKLTQHGAATAIPYFAPERSRIGFEIAPD